MPATQPISLINDEATAGPEIDVASADLSLVPESEPSPAIRRHLPDERRALTHHFSIAGQEGYLTVGVYEDGLLGKESGFLLQGYDEYRALARVQGYTIVFGGSWTWAFPKAKTPKS